MAYPAIIRGAVRYHPRLPRRPAVSGEPGRSARQINLAHWDRRSLLPSSTEVALSTQTCGDPDRQIDRRAGDRRPAAVQDGTGDFLAHVHAGRRPFRFPIWCAPSGTAAPGRRARPGCRCRAACSTTPPSAAANRGSPAAAANCRSGSSRLKCRPGRVGAVGAMKVGITIPRRSTRRRRSRSCCSDPTPTVNRRG